MLQEEHVAASPMNSTTLHRTAILTALVSAASVASAADVNLTADNGFGVSSFNSATSWSNSQAPSAGNNYFNNNNLLRTPGVAGSFVFGGDSLTITSALGFGANNDSLLFKGLGAGNVITVANLIVDGGNVRQASGNGDEFILAGNMTVTSNGAGFAVQGPTKVTANISGSGTVHIADNGSGEAIRSVHFQSAGNTFNGSINLASTRSYWALNNGGVMNFAIGANNVANAIYGTGNASIDGVFNFDISGADLTPGNSWNLVTATTKTFGTNFAITGFTEVDGLWTNGNGSLQFAEATGTLTSFAPIPEPSSFAALAGLAVLGFGATRRRRA